jgi:hypothetical protein
LDPRFFSISPNSFDLDVDIIFLEVPKFVIGHGNAFPNVVIGFWFIKVMESVEVLEFTEAIGLAFIQGPETELFLTGICHGRVFFFKLGIGREKVGY